MAKTIDIIKQTRTVPDKVKQNMKAFNQKKKLIVKTLEGGQKTIPEIAKEIDLEIDVITYHLMTLVKYGTIIVGEIDEDDEFYYYELKKKK